MLDIVQDVGNKDIKKTKRRHGPSLLGSYCSVKTDTKQPFESVVINTIRTQPIWFIFLISVFLLIFSVWETLSSCLLSISKHGFLSFFGCIYNGYFEGFLL